MKVLLIEDDGAVGSVMLSLLKKKGYEARWERSGLAAMRAARESQADIVLLDHRLGNITGADIAPALRGTLPNCKIWGIGSDGNPGGYCDSEFKKEQFVSHVLPALASLG